MPKPVLCSAGCRFGRPGVRHDTVGWIACRFFGDKELRWRLPIHPCFTDCHAAIMAEALRRGLVEPEVRDAELTGDAARGLLRLGDWVACHWYRRDVDGIGDGRVLCEYTGTVTCLDERDGLVIGWEDTEDGEGPGDVCVRWEAEGLTVYIDESRSRPFVVREPCDCAEKVAAELVRVLPEFARGACALDEVLGAVLDALRGEDS